jgi:hypothetical protein
MHYQRHARLDAARTGALLAATLGAALLALAVSPQVRADSAAPAAPVAGAWQRHEISVQYLGFMSAYSCDWLDYKLKMLLRASGARRDVTSTTSCRRISGPSSGAAATLTFYTLSPMGPGAEPASLNSAPATTAGTWQTVTLRDRSPSDLRASDCELLELFRDQILPAFTTRQVEDRTHCLPGEVLAGAMNLKFEVFEAAPASH